MVKEVWDREGEHRVTDKIKVGPRVLSISALVAEVFGTECSRSDTTVVVCDVRSGDSKVYESVREAAWECGVTTKQFRGYMRTGETFRKSFVVERKPPAGDQRWVSIRDVLGMKHRFWDPLMERVVLPEERRSLYSASYEARRRRGFFC